MNDGDNKGYPTNVPPYVVDLFEDLTFTVWEKGWDRYSARAILDQIRWECQIERGDREFKCNNNWTPMMARVFMTRYPTMKGFFSIRQLGFGRRPSHD